MKLLVADIGGTNARFAYQEKNNGDLNNFAYLTLKLISKFAV